MSIALFNEPIEIEVLKRRYDDNPEVVRQGLLLGFSRADAMHETFALTVDEQGFIWFTDMDLCRTKWRYDSALGDWDDRSGPQPDVPEVTEAS